MEQYSNFQIAHPLSFRKKFWKKMIEKLFVNFFLSILGGGLCGFIFYAWWSTWADISQSDSVSAPYGFLIGFSSFMMVYMILNVIYGIYLKFYIKRYYYDCSDKFITIKKGVFAPTEIHVQYLKIQDVYVDQDILDRIMGLYDVHIASATVTSGMEAHIDGVNREVAENIKNIILDKIQGTDGGTRNTNTISQTSQTSSNQGSVVFDEKISSNDYPIVNAWFGAMVVHTFISSFFWTLALIIFSVIGSIEGGFSIFGILPYILSYSLYVFLVIFIFKIIYWLIWKSNYYFELTPEFVLLKTGVISRQENHLPYKSIQNISTSQGIIERMFGLGTVFIENAASVLVDPKKGIVAQGGIVLVGQPIAKAEYLNQVLNKIVVSVKNPGSMGL